MLDKYQRNRTQTWSGLHLLWMSLMDQFRNTPAPYRTIHHSEQKCAHFCSEWCIVGYGIGAMCDFLDWQHLDDTE